MQRVNNYGRTPRVIVVAGARPNFVKIAPLMKLLRPTASGPSTRAVETLLLHTGQHYDEAMSRVFFDQLAIPRPDINLEIQSGSHASQTGQIMMRFESIVLDWRPDLVIVVGDVNSTIACALVAAKLGIAIAHVEAGLRSFDRTMPEEVNRVLTDAISDYLFVTERSGVENLHREGIQASKVFLVGNVMIDSLRSFLPAARATSILSDLGLSTGTAAEARARRFALVTLHRPSNVDDKEQLESILDVLHQIGRELPIIFPVHPRTRQNMERFGLQARLAPHDGVDGSGVRFIPPVGYLESLRLLSEACMVLTDSGGIQEETTALNVPCLTLRENTERPITVDQGTNILVGSDPRAILDGARSILAGTAKRGGLPDLWDGHAARRIVAILHECLQHQSSAIEVRVGPAA